jgi:hypothetical protein
MFKNLHNQRVSTSTTGDEYNNSFKWPHKYKSVYLNQAGMEAKQLVRICLSTNQETFGSCTFGQQD